MASLRAQGKTWRDIVAETGIPLRTVARRLQDSQAKEMLDQATRHHILTLPVALARHDELMASEDEGIALKAIESKYKIIGIAPTHTQSVFIQNLYVAKNILLQPQILSALECSQVIDAEVIEADD